MSPTQLSTNFLLSGPSLYTPQIYIPILRNTLQTYRYYRGHLHRTWKHRNCLTIGKHHHWVRHCGRSKTEGEKCPVCTSSETEVLLSSCPLSDQTFVERQAHHKWASSPQFPKHSYQINLKQHSESYRNESHRIRSWRPKTGCALTPVCGWMVGCVWWQR